EFYDAGQRPNSHDLYVDGVHRARVVYHGGFVERPDAWLAYVDGRRVADSGTLREAKFEAEDALGLVDPMDEGRRRAGMSCSTRGRGARCPPTPTDRPRSIPAPCAVASRSSASASSWRADRAPAPAAAPAPGPGRRRRQPRSTSS